MLDPRYVSENLDEVKAALAKRGFTDETLLGKLSELVAARLEGLNTIDTLRAERNAASKAMGQIKDKSSEEFAAKRVALRELGDRIKELEPQLKQTEAELEELILGIPNLPAEQTPPGLSEEENVEVKVWGDKPSFTFTPKDHVDLGEGLGILDFERATKLSGSRFVVLRGMAARLERALMQFMLDLHTSEHGYEEVWVPFLVNQHSLRGTGQLPKFADDLFRIADDEGWQQHQGKDDAKAEEAEEKRTLYLIPTAEVPVTNLHRDEIVEESELPIALTAYTPCFRAEAGSYGKDTRGMIRQHQFDKVEMVRFCAPEQAEEQHLLLVSHAEQVLQKLGLHYRVMELCAGDLGASAKRCFDLEVWLPSQNAYREISSCSWFGDYQARRMSARYRPSADEKGKKGKPRLLHTINGSGLAIGRTLVAILENYQQEDGSVLVPEALRPYLGGAERIARAEQAG